MNTNLQDNVTQYARDLAPNRASITSRGPSHTIAHMSESVALSRTQREDRHLIYRDGDQCASAEAFRQIRMRLLAFGGAENFVTLIVPVKSGSGGSFVARNLAAAFAFDEARTSLLIDCNFRRPAQHAAFGIDAAHSGLVDYLAHPSLGVQQVLCKTGIPRVRLIPAGRSRESSAEYFSSYAMRALTESLRSRYPDRYLFLDGPALSGSPDARILSDLADFVVIVAAYGRDTVAVINQAAASLDPKKLAGVVFNNPP